MFSLSRVAATGTGLALALLAVSGCKQGPSVETQARLDEATKVSTARDRVVQQIHYVTARINESERKLHDSEQRVHGLTTLSDSLRQTLEATIANYDSVLSQQKQTIVALTDQINQLTATNVALTDTVGQLKTQNNTVYYIIGTRAELMQRGIIVQEGGSRFPLIFAKLGQIFVPARTLNPKDFTPINKREVTEIPLPGPDKAYRITSRQDLDGLAAPPDDGGHISGSVKIANPDRFWSGSKFLIVVQG